MKRLLLAALAILLTACLSPSGGAAPQTAEPTPTTSALPTATATVSPTPTFTQTPQPTPTPDVSVMTDDEKIALVEGYDAENKFSSTIFPNIVIIDDGSSYLAYDIQTGEVSSLDDAGTAVFRHIDGVTHYELQMFDDKDEMLDFVRANNGDGNTSISSYQQHPDFYNLVKKVYQAQKYINLEISPSAISVSTLAITDSGSAQGYTYVSLYEVVYEGELSTVLTFKDEVGNLHTIIGKGILLRQIRGS
jgi:hypothetical protein